MNRIAMLALALCAGCSSAMAPLDGGSPNPGAVHTDTRVIGALRLALLDYPANAGIMFALPSVTGGAGNIVVENTRYGSLCRFAVDGSADQTGNTIALHISFAERLTSCTQEIRALKYTATLAEPAGTYDLLVIHDQNARADTLVRRTVTVR